jgi:hypothetical protein
MIMKYDLDVLPSRLLGPALARGSPALARWLSSSVGCCVWLHRCFRHGLFLRNGANLSYRIQGMVIG